jgi:hypothetical protein
MATDNDDKREARNPSHNNDGAIPADNTVNAAGGDDGSGEKERNTTANHEDQSDQKLDVGEEEGEIREEGEEGVDGQGGAGHLRSADPSGNENCADGADVGTVGIGGAGAGAGSDLGLTMTPLEEMSRKQLDALAYLISSFSRVRWLEISQRLKSFYKPRVTTPQVLFFIIILILYRQYSIFFCVSCCVPFYLLYTP